MLRFLQYFGRIQAARGSWATLPALGRGVVLVLALPGIVAIALSIVALVVSILALLVLTVPAYRIIRWISGGETASVGMHSSSYASPVYGSVGTVVVDSVRDDDVEVMRTAAPRRHVDVKIIEGH